jgi:ABC-type dipeptide/oligopeptide/nickel transport system ATPase component
VTTIVDLDGVSPVAEGRVIGPPPPPDVLLDVRGLKTHFHVMDGTVAAVDGVDFQLKRGETLGLVGESGCGKSVTSLTIMRLIDIPPGEIVAGEIWFDGREILSLPMSDMRQIRGADMSMIFQEPMTSLNPVFTVGNQIAEAVKAHRQVSNKEAWDRAVEMLEAVGIPSPERRVKQYPHELSGGMRQRVMIAMALSCDPKLIIADEPTTALDVTIQAQILELIKSMQERTGAALLLITHDLAVVAETVQRMAVMYAGKIVETGTAAQSEAPLYAGPHYLYPFQRGPRPAPERHPRHGAESVPYAPRLPIPAALSDGFRALSGFRSTASDDGPGSTCGLLAPLPASRAADESRSRHVGRADAD